MTIEISTFVNDLRVGTTTQVILGDDPIGPAEAAAFREALERVLKAFAAK
jgi:hypothetical protein